VSTGQRVLLAALIVDSAALALVELFFLPLRFDGTLLPDLGGFPFPVTIVLAAVTMPWLVTAATRITPRPLVAGAPLYVWAVLIAVLAVGGPGGDVVVIADWRALLLLLGGGMPGAIALGGAAALARSRQISASAKEER
jgi:hypothetical protein